MMIRTHKFSAEGQGQGCRKHLKIGGGGEVKKARFKMTKMTDDTKSDHR